MYLRVCVRQEYYSTIRVLLDSVIFVFLLALASGGRKSYSSTALILGLY